MVIDTLLFNNEFDMLDIHLGVTEYFVDRWIILEASRTFSGLPKPYHLKENLSKVNEKWRDRIEVVTLELTAEQNNLICETMMRKGLGPALEKYSPEDIIIHGDLDEVINPEKWNLIIETLNKHDKPVSCGFDMYFYKFDRKANRGWKGSVVARKRMFQTPHDLYKGSVDVVKRKNRSNCVGLDEPLGWHWTWMGSDDLIKTKVISCIESQHRDPNQVLSAFKDNNTTSAVNHKAGSEVVTTNYPKEVLEVITRYPDYWHNLPIN
jgi:beta-1,4-mannosyl-glycoprotein beta-1,4-N-acetylglucosaminyltransferase